MEFLIVLFGMLLLIGAFTTAGSVLMALVSGASRALSGRTAADDLADVLHAQLVLAHFEKMRDAILADDDKRLRKLEDELLELDAAAWTDYRTQLRDGARRAGITSD